jgi:hypothetical protein
LGRFGHRDRLSAHVRSEGSGVFWSDRLW